MLKNSPFYEVKIWLSFPTTDYSFFYIENGEGNINPLWYSWLENPMDGGAWQAKVHGVVKSWRQLSDFYLYTEKLKSNIWNNIFPYIFSFSKPNRTGSFWMILITIQISCHSLSCRHKCWASCGWHVQAAFADTFLFYSMCVHCGRYEGGISFHTQFQVLQWFIILTVKKISSLN